ncbi:MAG: CBS domain-containing protein [Miltoncostaeaceae bacterium]
MKVNDAMAHTVVTVAPHEDVRTIAEAMRLEGTGFVPVVENEFLMGVVTDRDIVMRAVLDDHSDPRDVHAHQVMSTGLTTVGSEDTLEDAARLMHEHEVRRLPVVDEAGRLLGVISHGNLVQATAGAGPGLAASLGVTRGA